MNARRVLLFACLVAATALAIACGIDMRGTRTDDGAPGGDGASSDAANTDGGAQEPVLLLDGDVGDAGVGIPFDAGLADASCDAMTFDDPLTHIDTKWLVTSGGNPGHPSVINANVGGSTRGIVSLISPHTDGARGGIWLASPVPAKALDVQFQVAADCGSDFFDGCADGFAAVWLDTSGVTGGLGAALGNASDGAGFGVPESLGGAGVAVDLYRNNAMGDPSTPALELITIDGAKTPSSYPWVTQSSSGKSYGGAVVHTVRLHLRVGQVTVSIDGKDVFKDVAVASPLTSAFGLTAATGGQNGVFYVWDFHAAFFACDP